MPDPAESLRETILRQCEASGPAPWYPKLYAAQAGADREALYAPLNDLRLAHLVELTEWVAGQGQGYLITPLGREVLGDPLFLAQLRAGKTAAVSPAAPSVPPTAPTPFERGEAARASFLSVGTARLVPTLILLNILAFATSVAIAAREGVPVPRFVGDGDPIVLDKVGGLSVTGLAKGEWWRLVSNTFLHYGLMHLAMNMFTLYLLRRVEALWGPGRFLVLYLICGLCGSCAGVYFHPADGDKVYTLAGASGALWGVMMSEVGWLALNRAHLPAAEVRQASQNILLTLLLNVGVSLLPNVSAAAHFGGGLAGFLCALLLQVHRFGPPTRRTLAGMQLALLPTLCLLGLSGAMENDSRLQPFVLKEYRGRIDERVGRLPPAFGPVEARADALYARASARRDPVEIESVRADLQGVSAKAKEAGDWVNRSSPPDPAKSLKETATRLVEALTAYADALRKRASDEDAGDVNTLRKSYQEAKGAWDVALTK